MMKKFLLLFIFSSFYFFTFSQENPVHFTFSHNGDTLVVDTKIDAGWHLYAVHLPNPNEGPLPTEFVFNPSKVWTSEGEIIEETGHTEMDDAFGVEVKFFENYTVFKQPIKTYSNQFNVSGKIYYMVCNDQMCIPLEREFDYEFVKK